MNLKLKAVLKATGTILLIPVSVVAVVGAIFGINALANSVYAEYMFGALLAIAVVYGGYNLIALVVMIWKAVYDDTISEGSSNAEN